MEEKQYLQYIGQKLKYGIALTTHEIIFLYECVDGQKLTLKKRCVCEAEGCAECGWSGYCLYTQELRNGNIFNTEEDITNLGLPLIGQPGTKTIILYDGYKKSYES